MTELTGHDAEIGGHVAPKYAGNACPPEDVGGLHGYEEFVRVMRNPSHQEHDAMWRWWGGPFDPTSFDINSANRAIRLWLSTGD